jgi:hypothetical protein
MYPNVPISALDMDKAALIKKVLSLPGFTGGKEPEKKEYLKWIRNEWVSIRMPETFYVNDSAYL